MRLRTTDMVLAVVSYSAAACSPPKQVTVEPTASTHTVAQGSTDDVIDQETTVVRAVEGAPSKGAHYVAVAAWGTDAASVAVGATESETFIDTSDAIRVAPLRCTQVLGQPPALLWCLGVNIPFESRAVSLLVAYSNDAGYTWHLAARRPGLPIPALRAGSWPRDRIIYSEVSTGAFWTVRADTSTTHIVFERLSSAPPNLGWAVSFYSTARLCRVGADRCHGTPCDALDHTLNCIDGPNFGLGAWYAVSVPKFSLWASTPSAGWWGGDRSAMFQLTERGADRWKQVRLNGYAIYALTSNSTNVFALAETETSDAYIIQLAPDSTPTMKLRLTVDVGAEYGDFNGESGMLALGGKQGVFVLRNGKLVAALP